MKKYIKRLYYQKKIEPYINKNLIKVIIGQRRVGKSYFLYQLMDYIKEQNSRTNIIFINKEFHEFDEIRNYKDLIEYIDSKKMPNEKNYIFIDEIQDIEQFEKALRHYFAKGKYDIYCSGSNAKLLSGELATFLSGRYIEIKIYGLSYREFLKFHKLQNENKSLTKYIKFGGLPYLINLDLTTEIVYPYLMNVYNTIVLKDIVARHQLRDVSFLEKLVKYLSNNVGSIVSARKISDFLKSQKISKSTNIVLNYLHYLVSAFFVFKVSRYDILGKKMFEIGEKYYFEDLGIRHAIIGYSQKDINKILENLVFIHLSILGYEIMVGKSDKKEIDFVCTKNNKKLYIQVTYIIPNEKVWHREFDNLAEIKDNYKKIVISMDEIIGEQYEGIEHYHILDFLNNFNE